MEKTEALASFIAGRVKVIVGDITEQRVDAIVNAANSGLLGGGGVDGAIHRKGGAQILEECREIRRTVHPKGLPTGEAVITSGGRLPARHVIHTVGPVRGTAKDAENLAACYRNSLALAVQYSFRSVAFPAISTGIFGYPREEAAAVASSAIQDFLSGDTTLAEVRLVFFSATDADVFLRNHRFSIE